MSEQNEQENSVVEKGWKPIPVALKILSVIFVLWMVGAAFNLPRIYENGIPLFGTVVYGLKATIVPLVLDFIGPGLFLYALWNRRSWAATWAFIYNGVFILIGLAGLVTAREELGLPQILAPVIASIIFVGIIFWNRGYFRKPSDRN